MEAFTREVERTRLQLPLSLLGLGAGSETDQEKKKSTKQWRKNWQEQQGVYNCALSHLQGKLEMGGGESLTTSPVVALRPRGKAVEHVEGKAQGYMRRRAPPCESSIDKAHALKFGKEKEEKTSVWTNPFSPP